MNIGVFQEANRDIAFDNNFWLGLGCEHRKELERCLTIHSTRRSHGKVQ
jgi:hypothetical protein